MVLDCIYGYDDYERLKKCIEPCESTCFSAYIDVEGKFFPCSFCPGQGDWVEGLDVIHCNDFIEDIWMHEKTVKFRNQLLLNNRKCIMYDLFN